MQRRSLVTPGLVRGPSFRLSDLRSVARWFLNQVQDDEGAEVSVGPERSIEDLGPALGFQAGDEHLHLGEALGRVRVPRLDLADHAQRRARAVGLGRVAGEALIREVGVVLERAGRLDEVDALSPLAFASSQPQIAASSVPEK